MDLSKIEHDFTEEEQVDIKNYVTSGCYGLESLSKDESKIHSMFSLYMAGKTYLEISRIAGVKKNLVMFMSAKMRWHQQRMEYLRDIQKEMVKKIAETRVESLNFIASLVNFHHKYYGDKINQYLATGDAKHVEGVDLKSLSQYFKSMEMLEKIMNPVNVNTKSSPTININAGSGSEIKMNESSIEITPGKTGDILKALAKLKDENEE